MKPPFHINNIDYGLLADAINQYKQLGWEQIEVPWIVSLETLDATMPTKSRRFAVADGHLVGSAEQGFIELAARGLREGRFMAVTPCFRDEEVESRTHQRWFLKLELWDTLALDYKPVLADALQVMRKLAPGKVIQPFELGHTHDIVCETSGRPSLELGSYGRRAAHVYGRMVTWNYGTGIALPRFSQA